MKTDKGTFRIATLASSSFFDKNQISVGESDYQLKEADYDN